jgi:hypothetical protein
LGIRNLQYVNLSLLAKWRWRLLLDEEEVWKNVITAKYYGEGVLGSGSLDASGNMCSPWWMDICNLDKGVGWFNQLAVKQLGRGNSIKFWKDVWVGDQTLEQRFPRLFSISSQQEEMVMGMGSWINGVWRWRLLWRRTFFVWEETLRLELDGLLNPIGITQAEDRWVWRPNIDDGFSVKSL